MNYYYKVLIALIITPFGCLAQQTSEIPIKRTLYSDLFVKSDGTKEEVISPKPLNYEIDGEWFPINTELEFSSG